MRIVSYCYNERKFHYSLCFSFLQRFDKDELLECIQQLVKLDQEWVPYSTSASLYIRPTLIGTEVTADSLFWGTVVGKLLLFILVWNLEAAPSDIINDSFLFSIKTTRQHTFFFF